MPLTLETLRADQPPHFEAFTGQVIERFQGDQLITELNRQLISYGQAPNIKQITQTETKGLRFDGELVMDIGTLTYEQALAVLYISQGHIEVGIGKLAKPIQVVAFDKKKETVFTDTFVIASRRWLAEARDFVITKLYALDTNGSIYNIGILAD